MADLALVLSSQLGEDYCVVQYERNANGSSEWACYAPKSGWTKGDTYFGAAAKQLAREERAAEFREQARVLMARADALEAKP